MTIVQLQPETWTKVASSIVQCRLRFTKAYFRFAWAIRVAGGATPTDEDSVNPESERVDFNFQVPCDVWVKCSENLNVYIEIANVAGAVSSETMRVSGYDPADDMLKVKSVQKKFRDSFAGSSLNTQKWDSSIGAGGAVTVNAGLLTMGSGTTANSETSITTKDYFTIPFRVNIGLTMSQRIANQSFFVEAISIDPVTLLPDGQHTTAWLFDGTTVTQAKYRVQNSGVVPLDSAASTIVTTATGGFYELEPFADESWFHSGTLDSSAGRANSYRRHQQIPEPNALFKIRLRWLNGSTPPASNTNTIVQYISIQDYAELTAEITAGRGNSVSGQAMAVAVTSAPTTTVTGTVTANVGTSGCAVYTDSSTAQAAGATLTGTARDAGSTVAYDRFVVNAFADQAGTVRIEKSTDNVTWRRASKDIAVAINAPEQVEVRVTARYHRVVYVNGGTIQTAFLLTSAYQRG